MRVGMRIAPRLLVMLMLLLGLTFRTWAAHVHSHQQRHRLQLVVNANAGLECHRRAEYSSNRRNIFHICFRERTVVRIQ